MLYRQLLKDNIYLIPFIEILTKYKLDITFIVKYILNPKYQLCQEDNITLEQVLKYQPHIIQPRLIQEMINYDSDDDSIDDFC